MADFTILGQGLAGSLLAWALQRTGAMVRLVDRPVPGAASLVAPGLVNPLSGRKFTTNWRAAEARPAATAFYAELEDALGQRFWHATPLLRLPRDADQAHALAARQNEPAAATHIAETFAPGSFADTLDDAHGSFLTAGAGWLDVSGLVERLRGKWLAEGALQETEATLDDLDGTVIDCRGWRAAQDPAWAFIPWKPARGEILDLAIPNEALVPRIYNRGEWLVPVGAGQWRAGATYAWSRFDAPPEIGARLQLEGQLRQWVRVPWHVTGQRCGVRPIVHDFRPVLGRHPATPHWFIFNGLGSHGVSQGPLCAQWLAAHLRENTPLPAEVDVARFAGA